MIKKTIFVLLFPTAILFSQQHRLFWDGGDWKRVESKANHNPETIYQIKAAYINGLMDGRLYDYLKTWNIKPDLADSIYADISDYMSTREMVKAIDYFYEDPFHLTLPLPSAMVIATMYAEQMPLPTIDNYIKQSRFWINQLYIQLEEENASELLQKKIEKHSKKLKRN